MNKQSMTSVIMINRIRISLVINTLNEERNIADCIGSAMPFVNEVIVCDMWSDDRTVEIAKNLGARVVMHEKTGYVEPARFYAISQATGEWVLVLDADERMTEKLGYKLLEIANEGKFDAVEFWSLYWYFGDWVKYGDFFHGRWARFFKKSTYLETYKKDEEYIHHNFDEIQRRNNKVNLSREYYIKHFAYPTIESYCVKTIGRYARIEAEQFHMTGRKFTYFRLIADPVYHILRNYQRGGLREGTRFFILTMMKAFFRFSLWANLWVLEDAEKRKEGIRSEYDESREGKSIEVM